MQKILQWIIDKMLLPYRIAEEKGRYNESNR